MCMLQTFLRRELIWGIVVFLRMWGKPSACDAVDCVLIYMKAPVVDDLI